MTIFGESAGAMAVGALLASPAARGRFARAILQSGAAHNVSSPEDGARVAEVFLDEAGIRSGDLGKLVDLSTEEVLGAQMRTMGRLALAHGNLPWQPTIDGDLLPEDPLSAIAGGASREIPLIIGTNRDEWNLFLIGDKKARAMGEDGLLRRYGRAIPGDGHDGLSHAEAAHAAYRSARGDAAPIQRWSAFQTDRVFRLPAEALTAAQRSAGGRVHSYVFTWRPPIGGRITGSAHALELPLLFGTWRHPFYRALYNGPAARRVARTMQRAWTRFAHGDDPEDWRDDVPTQLGRIPAAPEVGHPEVDAFWQRPGAELRGA